MAGGWPGALNTQGYGERTELLVRRKLRGDLMLFSDTQWQYIEKTVRLRAKKSCEKSIPGELQNLIGPCPEQSNTTLLLVILWAGHWTRNLQRILPAYNVLWSTEDTTQSSLLLPFILGEAMWGLYWVVETQQGIGYVNSIASLHLNIFPLPVPYAKSCCLESQEGRWPGTGFPAPFPISTPKSTLPDISKTAANRSLRMYK